MASQEQYDGAIVKERRGYGEKLKKTGQNG